MQTNNFSKKVINIVANIPIGETMSYKQVATLAGSSLAYRAVGNILKNNYNKGSRDIPCHRVIRSGGQIGGYAGGTKKKRRQLKNEQINS